MSLFQNAVVAKYLQVIKQDSLNQKQSEFVAYFHNTERQENISKSKEEQYQKGFLRELFRSCRTEINKIVCELFELTYKGIIIVKSR